MAETSSEFWQLRADVSEALDVFRSGYIQEIWGRALARKENEPEAAVTAARTLLEAVCKFILEEANEKYEQHWGMAKLYNATRNVLELAPDQNTAPILAQLFDSCAQIVINVGSLRNHLSDAHGRGRFGTTPDWRHSELAVNLSGAMATYLAAVWQGRQPTVADLIKRFLQTGTLDDENRQVHVLKRMADRMAIGKVVAAKLDVNDIVAHCQACLEMGNKPQSIAHEISALSLVMGESKEDVLRRARRVTRASGLTSKSEVRTRRVSDAEIDALNSVYEKQNQHERTKVPMDVLTLFLVWSGRKIGEIVQLRWDDVDFENGTCKTPAKGTVFPIYERAWDIIVQRSKEREDSKLIFPYLSRTASARATMATKKLASTMPTIADLQLSDLRYEAVNRLLEKGHPPHTVAKATGMNVRQVIQIHDGD